MTISFNLNKPKKENRTLDEVQKDASVCQACRLCETRKTVVFGCGNPAASILIVGEGPGQDEDEQGIPFVGRSGQLLNAYLEKVGLDRDRDVYITNVIKCRPPGNRQPDGSEIDACRSFLDAQIDIMKPSIIVALGATALKRLMGPGYYITQVRGKWYSYTSKIDLMPIFHPSYLLRNPSNEKFSPRYWTWIDFTAVRKALGGF